jgi:hypothetical protein
MTLNIVDRLKMPNAQQAVWQYGGATNKLDAECKAKNYGQLK